MGSCRRRIGKALGLPGTGQPCDLQEALNLADPQFLTCKGHDKCWGLVGGTGGVGGTRVINGKGGLGSAVRTVQDQLPAFPHTSSGT